MTDLQTMPASKWSLLTWIIRGGLLNWRAPVGKRLTVWGQILLLLGLAGFIILPKLTEIQEEPLVLLALQIALTGWIVLAIFFILRGYRQYSDYFDRNYAMPAETLEQPVQLPRPSSKAPAKPVVDQPHPSWQSKTFQERYCEAYHCPPQKFSRTLFWRSVPRRILPLAWFIKLFNPSFFTVDINLIDELRQVRDDAEFQSLIDSYHDSCHINRNFFHDRLNIRISTRRLVALCSLFNRP